MGIEPTTSRLIKGIKETNKVRMWGSNPISSRSTRKIKKKENKINEVVRNQSHNPSVPRQVNKKEIKISKNETKVLGLDLGSPSHLQQNRINKKDVCVTK